MAATFDTDPYPGMPKILFVGLGTSTHTHSWVDLLSEAKMNIRLFCVPESDIPPKGWNIRTYICAPSLRLTEGLDTNTRQCLYLRPDEIKERESKLKKRATFWAFNIIKKVLNYISTNLGLPKFEFDYISYFQTPKAMSPEEWLAEIVQDWKPDVIHTLGLFDAQGGLFYYEARKRMGLEKIGKWVLQLRGGSDMAFTRNNLELRPKLVEVLQACDHLFSDNTINFRYAKELGVDLSGKIPEFRTVPGTGGIDVKHLANSWQKRTSERRIIVFPKAYELPWSKALPVFEALKIGLEQIEPCTIHILNTTPEIRNWYYTLPESIRSKCCIHERIPRKEFFSLLSQARVLLIPSLVDGIPNSMYEAMALGAFPIVSPLETITSVVENEKNVLFARNLYPHEIADALVRAMNDDGLVDAAAQQNAKLVEKIANRETIRPKVVAYYEKLAKEF